MAKGFALIEVSIALLVLGIITSISMSQMANVRRIQADIITHQRLELILKSFGAYYCSYRGKLPLIDYSNGEFGIVPYRELGIMEKQAKDGYGKFILCKINQVTDDKSMGIAEFKGALDDKVFIILKASNGIEEWISKNNFIYIYCSGRQFQAPQTDLKQTLDGDW